MHTRAAAAICEVEASNKIATGKVTSDRIMSRPFPTTAYWYAVFCVAVSDFSVLRFPGTHLRSRLDQKCEAILLEYRLSGH